MTDVELELGEEDAKVFLSYSRRDREGAQRIADVLRERSFGVFRDTDDILPTEEWRGRLEQLIAEADTIVFLLSPNSVTSEVCAWEVEYATSLNKRIAPIVIEEVNSADIPPLLARLNFIFCTERDRFEDAVDSLVSALNTDIDWIREHTRLAGLAQRWEERGRSRGLLLRGQDVSDAEAWRDGRPSDAPDITVLQSAFVAESRRHVARTQRRIVGLSLAAGVVALGLAGLAYWQRDAAIDAEAKAVQERNDAQAAQSRYLADLATQAVDQGDAVTGILTSLEALRDATSEKAQQRQRPYVASAESSLVDALHQQQEKYVFAGHRDFLENIAFSPDGTMLATTSFDKTVRIWSLADGRFLGELTGHEKGVNAVAFSPDGSRIVTASSDETVRLWNRRTREEIAVHKVSQSFIRSVVYSRDGRFILTGTGELLDAATFKLVGRFGQKDYEPWKAYFSPTEDKIITVDGFHARLFDVATGREIGAQEHGDSVNDAEFSKSGEKIVTTFNEDQAYILDGKTGRGLVRLEGHEEYTDITDARFSPDGRRVVTGSGDKTARLWDVEDGRQIAVLRGHEESVNKVAYSPDGKMILTVSYDRTARLWDAEAGNLMRVLRGHHDGIQGGQFSPDGRYIATVGYDRTIRIWTVRKGASGTSARKVRTPAGGSIRNVDFSDDGTHVVVSGGGDHSEPGVRLIDLRSGRFNEEIPLKANLSYAVFAPGGKSLLVVGYNFASVLSVDTPGRGSALQREQADDSLYKVLPFSFDPNENSSFSRDASKVMTIHGGGAIVWGAADGIGISHRKIPAVVRGGEISNDGMRAVVSGDKGIAVLWDTKDGSLIADLKGHTASVHDVAFSPDDRLVATVGGGKDHSVRLWDGHTGAPIHVMEGHTGGVLDVAFSPDGQRVASGGWDNTVRIWRAKTGKLEFVLKGHLDSVERLAFTPDGAKLLSTSEDRTARLWSLATGEQIAIYRGHSDEVHSLDFSPDGSMAAMGSWDNTARIWSVFKITAEAIERAKAVVPRCLNPKERAALHLSPEPPAWCIEKGKWPYNSDKWRQWLAARREGGAPPLPN